MDQQEHRPVTDADEAAAPFAAANDVICTDAATLNSDAAVVDGMGGAEGQPPPAAVAAAAAMAGARSPDGYGGHINSHARQRHYRKRAFSTTNSSGTLDTSCSMNGNVVANNNTNSNFNAANLSGASFMMNSSTIGSHIMSSGAENSIVSFGLNFNFDGASSPSNSDSGGGKGGGDAGSSGEDDNNNGNVNNNVKTSGINKGTPNGKATGEDGQTRKKKTHKKASKNPPSPGTNDEGKGSNGSSKCKKAKKEGMRPSVKFGPNCTTGANAVAASASAAVAAANAVAATTAEEGASEGSSSTSSGSDSSMNDMNESGGSASGESNSGGDGSSGGKSTVSSLTTSSNQEWMAANESAVRAAEAEGAAVAAANDAQGRGGELEEGGKAAGEGVADGNATATTTDPMSGKKRKQASTGDGAEESNARGEDDDGYKTDEELWGGNRHNTDDTGNHHHPTSSPAVGATFKGALKASSKKSANDDVGCPPMKQARFSMDQHPSTHSHEHVRHPGGHPENVESADASAQPLSSLSGSDSAGGRYVAVTFSSGGGTPGLPSASAVTTNATSSNPSNSTPGLLRGVVPSSSGGKPKQRSKSGVVPAPQAVATGAVAPDKRKERNAREKERSCRIAKQIDDLRTLLSRGGVIVSKGTKSSVLSEAANYINLLQQQQVQWEMDRQALMQQVQQVVQNPPQNVMSMGVPNGLVDPQAAPQQLQMQQGGLLGQVGHEGMAMNGGQQQQQQPPQNQNAVSPNDYKFIFNNSSVGMAIASLGGAFVDCNAIFCQLSEYTKEEVCAMTIFNVTSRQDLQHAFDLISQMITPTLENSTNNGVGVNGSPGGSNDKGDDKSSIVLRGAMKKRTDLGLSISLIKGDQGIAKCFCVTLVRILSMETTRPDTVAIQMELPQVWSTRQQKNVGFGTSPAYTSG